MQRFYYKNKNVITNIVLLMAVILAFVLPSDNFWQGAFTGFAVGLASIKLGYVIANFRKARKIKQLEKNIGKNGKLN